MRLALFFTLFLSATMGELSCAKQCSARDQIGTVMGLPVYRDELRRDWSVRDELCRLFVVPLANQFRRANKTAVEPADDEVSLYLSFMRETHRKRIERDEQRMRDNLHRLNRELTSSSLGVEERKRLTQEQHVLTSQLTPPDREMARFFVDRWKFERCLYDRFGGGRILMQQGGLEAFDAARKWLQSCEAKGDLAISDRQMRKVLFDYWSNDDGVFLKDDQIRREFLEPTWRLKK